MAVLRVSAKGQTTLNRDLLRRLGVQVGAKITLHKLPGARIVVEAARPTAKISDVFGILRQEGRKRRPLR